MPTFPPDLQYIESVTHEIARNLRPGQLVCPESTTYPGTTEEVMKPILEESGLRAGVDFFLVHSPERVASDNKLYTTKNTSKGGRRERSNKPGGRDGLPWRDNRARSACE